MEPSEHAETVGARKLRDVVEDALRRGYTKGEHAGSALLLSTFVDLAGPRTLETLVHADEDDERLICSEMDAQGRLADGEPVLICRRH